MCIYCQGGIRLKKSPKLRSQMFYREIQQGLWILECEQQREGRTAIQRRNTDDIEDVYYLHLFYCLKCSAYDVRKYVCSFVKYEVKQSPSV